MTTFFKDCPDNEAMRELRLILSELPELNMFSGPWVAGGAVRRVIANEPIHHGDIDIFFNSNPQLASFNNSMQMKAFIPVNKSSMATSYAVSSNGKPYIVQAISKKMYGNPNDLMNDFDFTVCQTVTDGQILTYRMITADDIEKKILRIAKDGQVTPLNSIARISKYISYGFEMAPGSFEKAMVITNNYLATSARSKGPALVRSRLPMAVVAPSNGASYTDISNELDAYGIYRQSMTVQEARERAEAIAVEDRTSHSSSWTGQTDPNKSATLAMSILRRIKSKINVKWEELT